MNIFNFLKNGLFIGGNKDNLIFEKIINEAYLECSAWEKLNWFQLKATDVKTFLEKVVPLNNEQKLNFILNCISYINEGRKRRSWSSNDISYKKNSIVECFLKQIFKSKISLSYNDISKIFYAFKFSNGFGSSNDILSWPVKILLNHAFKKIEEDGMTKEFKNLLLIIRETINLSSIYYQKEAIQIIEKIDQQLYASENKSNSIKPSYFVAVDQFGNYANHFIENVEAGDRSKWFSLITFCKKASGSKPSSKFCNEIEILFNDLGPEKYKKQINEWLLYLAAMKERVEEINTGGHSYTEIQFISTHNTDTIKGFIWSCIHFHDKTTLYNISKVAERSFRKIPGKGPAAEAIGNACLFVLAHAKGMDGIGHLSRLRLRVKQNSTQNIIEKYLHEAAIKQGVSIYEIEDMAIDEYGLQNGQSTYEFEGFKLVLKIVGIGKVELNWFKPDGLPQKSIPLIIKTKHLSELKQIKEISVQIEKALAAQRNRLDRMLKSNYTLTGTRFLKYYFSHGLMCYVTHKLIWVIEKFSKSEVAYYLNGNWRNCKDELIEVEITEESKFSLWHPIVSSVDDIIGWREFLNRHKIKQPFKQAYREIYLLTDAEINTVIYSNRMAGHILKQHQFNSLVKSRGWKYNLMGAYDNGINSDFASLELKEYGLRAEYWINEVNNEDAFNETGIWLYIATDQIRFTDLNSGDVKELIEIPNKIFTEIMRDVDLFVGVASVGNDPNWVDGGGIRDFNAYWQSYSFGDLTEMAKTRKTILEGLLPRLKIGNVSTIIDKFLVVKGSIRTYKIHLGSSNILMEPNDQYLCIVAERGKKDVMENIFLPFEGDNGLSLILSKAILLAEDNKIEDPTILSQINRK